MNNGVDSLLAGLPAQPDVVDRIWQILDLGGPVAVILVGTSVIALAIILAKLWQFGSVQAGNQHAPVDALELYRAGRLPEALAVAGKSKNPVALTMACAIRGRLRSLPEESVREEAMRHGMASLESLRSGFRALEVIASLAPLLGLFGTVLGMIEAFREMEQAGNRVSPDVLSGGIWTALLTTALGLGVAMPVVVALAWLERRVERLAHAMSDMVTAIFTVDLSRDSTQDEGFGYHQLPTEPAVADS